MNRTTAQGPNPLAAQDPNRATAQDPNRATAQDPNRATAQDPNRATAQDATRAGAPPQAEWGEPRVRTVNWYDPQISAAAGGSMSGREFLEAIADGRLPRPPFAELVGARLTAVREGEAVFRCVPDEATYNPGGIVHGGLLCMLLDSACGCAVQSLLPAGVAISSIEIKVSFMSALRSDSGELEIAGKALRVGRQVAFAEAHARNGDGKLVGHATSSIAVIRSLAEPDKRSLGRRRGSIGQLATQ